MKLHGSLNNRIDENRMFVDEIEVGTDCTEYLWSDRHAYWVSNVIDGKTIEIKRYSAKRIDGNGMSDAQAYEYVKDDAAKPIMLKMFKNRWHLVKRYKKHDDAYLDGIAKSNLTEKQRERFDAGEEIVKRGNAIDISFGVAEEYYDYTF